MSVPRRARRQRRPRGSSWLATNAVAAARNASCAAVAASMLASASDCLCLWSVSLITRFVPKWLIAPSSRSSALNAARCFLVPAEVHALADAALPGLYHAIDRALYLTAAFTGLRQGELRGLLWQHVDFDASRRGAGHHDPGMARPWRPEDHAALHALRARRRRGRTRRARICHLAGRRSRVTDAASAGRWRCVVASSRPARYRLL
jgi:integrase